MGIMIDSDIMVIPILIWFLMRVSIFFRSRKKGKSDLLKREILLNIFFIYLIVVISLLFLPIDIIYGQTDISYSHGRINLIPIVETVRMVSSGNEGFRDNYYMIKFAIKNILGNILLLMPLAILMPILFKRFTSYRTTILFGMLVSLTIEILQYLESFLGSLTRITDIDDFILNTMGLIIGFFIYDKFIKLKMNQQLPKGIYNKV